MKYNLRTKGTFTNRTNYALHALLLALKELAHVRWIKCASLAYLIAIPLTLAYDAYKPEPTIIINEAHAEELAPKPVQIEVRIDWTKERIIQEIETQASKYGVSAELMKRIVKCESNYDIDVQSNHTLSYGREQSWGLSQIHLPSHKNVTKEQAIDPIFALDFMAKNIAQGNANMWTCYSKKMI